MIKKFTRFITILILSVMIISQSNIPMVAWLMGNQAGNTVYAAVSASKIKLNKKTLFLKEGESQSLMATITPSNVTNKKINWSSSNNKVATVTSSGKVRAIKAGRAVITAKTGNGKKALCKITVTKPIIKVTTITLDMSSITMDIDDTIILQATILPIGATDTELTWSSEDESIVYVDQEGTVLPIEVGTAVIMVESENGITASCTVTVTSDEEEYIDESSEDNFTYEGIDSEQDSEVDSGSNDLNSNDNNEAVNEDTNASIDSVDVTAVILSPVNITLNIGDEAVLVTTIEPDYASDKTVLWASNNTSIATVDAGGTITAKAKGSATITVTTTNGKTATCIVTITDIPRRAALDTGKYNLTLKAANLCLDVNGAVNTNGANVQVYESNNTKAQIWTVENHDDGTVCFIPECATDKVLDVMRTNNSVSGALQSGCNVDIYTHNDIPAQHFYLEQFSDGSYIVRLNSNSNLVVQASSSSSGANVEVGNYDENNNLQRWNIVATSGLQNVESRRTAYVCNTGGQGVFVRDQGSTAGGKLGGFAEGQEIVVIGDIINGWYKVEGADRNTGATIKGYAYGDYITFTKATSTTPNISFAIRTTAPASNDFHYYSNQNIYYASNCGMPNCVAYAWGRIWEIYGTKLPSKNFIHDAYSWWDDNIRIGKYKYGSEPRVGAIAVWSSSLPKSGGAGHVAVVEKIDGGVVYVSQSYYNGTLFRYAPIDSTGYLKGYIYVDQPNY